VTDIFDHPDDDLVVYELAEWSIDQRASLGEALANLAIPHGWEGIDLVVHVDFEDQVDEICDAIERGEALDFDDGEPSEVLGHLFEAADRLMRDASDVDAGASLLSLAEQLDPDTPPFGVDPTAWERVIDAVDDLADGLAEDDEKAVTATAGSLRGLLRPLV